MSQLDVCAASNYSITVTWTATDECNNSTMATQTIDVIVDLTPPVFAAAAVDLTIPCSDLSTTSSTVGAWLSSITATDGCDNAPVVTNDYVVSNINLCANTSTLVTWTATDACGNATITSANLIVMGDTEAPIAIAPTVALAIDCASISSCLLYTSPSPRDLSTSRMPSSA